MGEGAGAAQGRDNGGPHQDSGRDGEEREWTGALSSSYRDYLMGKEDISVPGTQPQRFRFNWSGVGSRHWALFFPNNVFYVSKYVQPIVISICNQYSNINQIITFLFTFLPCIQTLVLYVTLRVHLYSD